jgi:hypothetical protein
MSSENRCVAGAAADFAAFGFVLRGTREYTSEAKDWVSGESDRPTERSELYKSPGVLDESAGGGRQRQRWLQLVSR